MKLSFNSFFIQSDVLPSRFREQNILELSEQSLLLAQQAVCSVQCLLLGGSLVVVAPDRLQKALELPMLQLLLHFLEEVLHFESPLFKVRRYVRSRQCRVHQPKVRSGRRETGQMHGGAQYRSSCLSSLEQCLVYSLRRPLEPRSLHKFE